jgi:predicted ester cyclase
MADADHRRVVEDFYAANGPMADPALFEQLFHPDYVSHTSPPDSPPGIGQMTSLQGFLDSALSDVRYELIRQAVDGDLAAAHVRIGATHTGDGLGFPATGKQFSVEQMHFMRFADGRIAEHWAVRDDAGMMRQLGLIGAPA